MRKEQRKSMIRVRGGFSDKMNLEVVTNVIQTKDFDYRTRTIISNRIRSILCKIFESELRYKLFYDGDNPSDSFSRKIISDVFLQPINAQSGMLYDWRGVYDKGIYDVFMNASYNEVLDMIWFICKWLSDNMQGLGNSVYKVVNEIFQQECVGYRFVNGEIIPITDDTEIKEIESAANVKFEGCRAHIKKAIGFLSNRDNPDYKNSIKESISAVEAVCQIITKNDKASLGQALKLLEDSGVKLHHALKNSFSALYGYTSDEGGIRHAEGLFESNVTFEEAKYMLVSCSAFINYLIAEYGNIKNNR